jgi:hypothetical protein
MARELLEKYSITPETPLQILQAGLEAGIQLVVLSLRVYAKSVVNIKNVGSFYLSDLGYNTRLCDSVLVLAAAEWDGFIGNIVRTVKENGHTFQESRTKPLLKRMNNYKRIIEPIARRHCIAHNHTKVDKEYKKRVPASTLNIGDSLETDLSYLKDASVAFFETAAELVKHLVECGLLPDEQKQTIGDFQRNPFE